MGRDCDTGTAIVASRVAHCSLQPPCCAVLCCGSASPPPMRRAHNHLPLPTTCCAAPCPPPLQTRGWFYTLMVLSTALFDKPAFKNLVCNGLVLAADGKKMSKRLKNYPVGGGWVGWLGGSWVGLGGDGGGGGGRLCPTASSCSLLSAPPAFPANFTSPLTYPPSPFFPALPPCLPACLPAGPDGGGQQVWSRRPAPLPHQLTSGE